MIRILHLIPAYDIGGIESLVMSLYRNIDKSQVQFDLLVETQEWLNDFEEIEKYGGKIHQLLPLNKRKPLGYLKQVKDFFEKYAKKYAVVHIHDVSRGIPVLYYAKRSGIACRIFHSHTDSVEGFRYKRVFGFMVRLNNRMSTDFFACSEQAGKFYFEKDKKKFIVLKNAIDTKQFSFFPDTQKSMRKSMELEGCFVIGHTGRFTYQKNQWKIIDVFYKLQQKLPQSRLLLIGDGETRKEIEEKANALGLHDKVIFTGARSDISDLLQCMDIFLLPSFFEGFCISLLEAQSTGLPCIVSNVIPPEVEVTDIVTKLDLNESHERWADTIVSQQGQKRKSQDTVISKKGYSMQENAKWLMTFYLDQVNRGKYYTGEDRIETIK